MNLHQEHCVACVAGTPALPPEQAQPMLEQIPDWSVSGDGTWLVRRYTFRDFAQALAFVNQVGAVAEAEGHHPDIKFGWGYVELHLQTHAAQGLHRNDFVLASKLDSLSNPPSAD